MRLSKLPHRRSMCGTLRSKWKKSINWPVIISLKTMTHKDAAMTSNGTNTIIKWLPSITVHPCRQTGKLQEIKQPVDRSLHDYRNSFGRHTPHKTE